MAVIRLANPKIITLEYFNKESTECSWARFKFDIDNNELFIASSCGNFVFAAESVNKSFIKFCSEIKNHLFEKEISDVNVTDTDVITKIFCDFIQPKLKTM